MQDKNDIDNLLVSYLLHELSEEDESAVVQAINADPVLQKELQELQQIFRLADIKQGTDKIDVTQERRRLEDNWQRRQAAAALRQKETISAVQDTTDKKRARRTSYLRAAAVAASVLLLMGIGWKLFRSKAVQEPAVVLKNSTREAPQKIFTRYETNVSGQARHFMLADGTEVMLSDQSIVTFSEPFTGNKRSIYLRGQAGFKVAKDKSKPFTVYSDGISTTALGTAFTVTSFDKGKEIIIRLEEGKVMVRSVDSIKRKLDAPYYLVPGQELVYNKQTDVAVIRDFKNDPVVMQHRGTSHAVIDDHPSLPNGNLGPWFMFNNQSLPQIFDQLELIYSVEIVYTKKDLDKLYFIGKFDKTDSLEYILRNIVNLNNLTLSKQNNKYIIHR